MVQIMAFYTCTKVREGSLEIKICQVPDNKTMDWCHNELKDNIILLHPPPLKYNIGGLK